MYVPAARQFQGLASWPYLNALPGEVPIGGFVNEFVASGNARQDFDEIT